MAYASGFGGQREEQTWAARIKRLHDLHFIDIKPGSAGPLGYAIIWNPHKVVNFHHDQHTPGLREASYNALVEWALNIGAKDMIGEDSPRRFPACPSRLSKRSLISHNRH